MGVLLITNAQYVQAIVMMTMIVNRHYIVTKGMLETAARFQVVRWEGWEIYQEEIIAMTQALMPPILLYEV